MKTPLHFLRRISFFAALLAAALGSGCTQVQVSPGVTGEYKLGELQVFAERNFRQVYDVAKETLTSSGMTLKRDDQKSYEAVLIGKHTDGTVAVVKIKQVAPNRTSVKIRYGVLNPELAAAQSLYDAMQKKW